MEGFIILTLYINKLRISRHGLKEIQVMSSRKVESRISKFAERVALH